MRTCSYCGRQYPAEALVCAVDQQPLVDQTKRRDDIAGIWRGSYSCPLQMREQPPVPFTLVLQQDRVGHIAGTVTEDPALGMPATGTIEGNVAFPRIEFVKMMPVCYLRAQDGRLQTLREYLAGQGLV